nr:hypothetical protein [Rhodococcus sp. 06-156-3b]
MTVDGQPAVHIVDRRAAGGLTLVDAATERVSTFVPASELHRVAPVDAQPSGTTRYVDHIEHDHASAITVEVTEWVEHAPHLYVDTDGAELNLTTARELLASLTRAVAVLETL